LKALTIQYLNSHYPMIIILYLISLIGFAVSYCSPQPTLVSNRNFGHLLSFAGTSPIAYCLSFLESILLNPLAIVHLQHLQTLPLLSKHILWRVGHPDEAFFQPKIGQH